jgi:hypothetical protein
MAPTNWELVLIQIKTLGESMNKSFDEVKGAMFNFDERVRGIEKSEVGCQAVVSGRLDAAEKKLDEHTSMLADLEKLVANQVLLVSQLIESQKGLNNILKWILGIFTAVIVVIVIGLATGQAQVVFK